eukprot:FR735701.1.p1 GENE.FR735701.1~~FR735701.1.p1  ORF type:complete len:227 (+),score=41.22 FR735701.1:63-683(+)
MKGTTYDGMMHHVDWYTTFMSLAEVSAMESEQELDGYHHWDAMRGLSEAPRTMIVYDINLVFDNVDRGWGNATVVYRRHEMKLMVNHGNDTWYPDAGTKIYGSTECYERECLVANRYSYNEVRNEYCGWTNFLFNLTVDPLEKVNLWHSPDYQLAKKKLVKEAQNWYDKHYYQNTEWNDVDDPVAQAEFHAFDNYVVPCDCSLHEN